MTRNLASSAAVTLRAHGKEQVIYAGTYLTREFTEASLTVLDRLGALPERVSTTHGVEVTVRMKPNDGTLRIAHLMMAP